MILVHGGGWVDVGLGQMEFMRNTLPPRWLERGWATVISGYRGCRQSIDDVLALYDAVRRRVGPGAPIGLTGESAGGHLALIVAAERRDVAVVVARAAPTSAGQLGHEAAVDPLGAPDFTHPRQLAAGWRVVFGEEWLTRFNPLHRAAEIRARVLLAQISRDPVIPAPQMFRMRDALRAARPGRWSDAVLLLPGEPFSHVTPMRPLADYEAAELQAVAPWQTGSPQAPHTVPGWWADTSPLWRGSPANPGTGRQCVPAPVLTRLNQRGAVLRLEGRGMPGSPVAVRVGRWKQSVPVSRSGVFEAKLRISGPAQRVTVAQRSAGVNRARTHALSSDLSVRVGRKSARNVRVTVGHPTARAVTLAVVDPHGCPGARRTVKLDGAAARPQPRWWPHRARSCSLAQTAAWIRSGV